jgi:hypothetical protein
MSNPFHDPKTGEFTEGPGGGGGGTAGTSLKAHDASKHAVGAQTQVENPSTRALRLSANLPFKSITPIANEIEKDPSRTDSQIMEAYNKAGGYRKLNNR